MLAGCGEDQADDPGAATSQASAAAPSLEEPTAPTSSGEPEACAKVLSDEAFRAMGWATDEAASAPTAGRCARTAPQGSLTVHVKATPGDAGAEFDTECKALRGDAGDVGADLGFIDTDAELCGRLPERSAEVGPVEIYAHTADDRLIVFLGAVLEATDRAALEKGLEPVVVAAVDDTGFDVG